MRCSQYTDLNLPTDGKTPHFSAVLYPNRSLPKHHFAILISVLFGTSILIGGAFLLAGAWPVLGFLGLDVLAVIVAFLLHYRSGKIRETLRLKPGHLLIKRFLPNGKELSWSLNPSWMRIEMDDPPLRRSELSLYFGGRRIVIGSFLTPTERLEIAKALRAAIDDCTTNNH